MKLIEGDRAARPGGGRALVVRGSTTPALYDADFGEPRAYQAPDQAHDEIGGLFRRTRMILFVFLGAFALWSLLAPINGAIVMPASLSVISEHQVVQHRDGGIVRSLSVNEGAQVSRGDILLTLDPVEAEAVVTRLRAQLDEAEATRNRLQSERDPNSALPIADAAADAPLEPTAAMAGQLRLKDARERNRQVSLEILRQRLAQAESRIESLGAERASAEKQLVMVEKELGIRRELLEQGHVTRHNVNEVEIQALSLSGEISRLGHQIEETNAQRREINLTIAQSETDLLESIEQELRVVETSIAELSSQLTAAEDALARTVIRAPSDGRVLGLTTHTIGAVVQPGERLMAVVPKDDGLYVAGKLRPTDIDYIRQGDGVRMTIASLEATTPPRLRGEVVSVSPDTLVDDASGGRYYLVRIKIVDFDGLAADQLVPGTPIEAYLESGGRSLVHYLLKPLLDAFDKGLA